MGIQQATTTGSPTDYWTIDAFESFTNGWWSGALYGFDYVPGPGDGSPISTGHWYGVDQTNTIWVVPVANMDSGHTTSFTVSSRPSMRPRNIRYSARKSRLYVPTMADCAVVEINPSSNTVTNTFTNFDVPWDILDTGTEIVAVQLGNNGLKKVV
jgi:hypothetical protein